MLQVETHPEIKFKYSYTSHILAVTGANVSL